MFPDSGSHSKLHYTIFFEQSRWFSNQGIICCVFFEVGNLPMFTIQHLLGYLNIFWIREWFAQCFPNQGVTPNDITQPFMSQICGFRISNWFAEGFLSERVNLSYLYDVFKVNQVFFESWSYLCNIFDSGSHSKLHYTFFLTTPVVLKSRSGLYSVFLN